MTLRETKWRRRRGRRIEKLRYNSLERSSFLCFDQGQGKQSTGGAESTLPHLLATYFHFCMPTGLFRQRCPGSDPGFFSHDF